MSSADLQTPERERLLFILIAPTLCDFSEAKKYSPFLKDNSRYMWHTFRKLHREVIVFFCKMHWEEGIGWRERGWSYAYAHNVWVMRLAIEQCFSWIISSQTSWRKTWIAEMERSTTILLWAVSSRINYPTRWALKHSLMLSYAFHPVLDIRFFCVCVKLAVNSGRRTLDSLLIQLKLFCHRQPPVEQHNLSAFRFQNLCASRSIRLFVFIEIAVNR